LTTPDQHSLCSTKRGQEKVAPRERGSEKGCEREGVREREREREVTSSAMMAMSDEPREVTCAAAGPAIASGVDCGSELAPDTLGTETLQQQKK
jgi:hypothetical protein